MRWLKHPVGGRNLPGLKRAEKLAGEVAYCRFFKVCEVVAQSSGCREKFDPQIDLSRPPQDSEWLADELGISSDELQKTLGMFAELGLIDADAWERKVVLLPALKEWADDWTGRFLRESGDTTKKLRSDSARLEESREEKKKEKKERIAHSALAPARDYAFESFEKKFGQKPAWRQADFVQLAGLFGRRQELTIEEFRRRWDRYLASSESFITQQGAALGFFCSRFDSFISGPVHDRGAAPKKSSAAQAREDERRRIEISPEGKKLLERFSAPAA